MNIIEKINRSRYNLKEILSNEWDTDIIHDLSDQEIEKMYTIQSFYLLQIMLTLVGVYYYVHVFLEDH